ncbi:PEP-CTERM sorting domain-containing protein [Catenovulum adriaticum]|uniref:PEP-CTERM sorting domain-containing protein n=1 Tax=Catenovulum adriaticum TaxID=2984846 RepID=A0ABY7AQL1_9ALTE|nr:PEP-CTERM sorting domain-containing protein [Catenovulum sp. TS8]WAJ71838.1 PEP-CTERM sorting domain-containing protein [Catenovulum sp. TS8]
MKSLMIFFAWVLTFNANAGLITTQPDQTTYNSGDIVTVDFYVNNANPIIDWLNVEYRFDDSLFSFDSFTVTNEVFSNSYLDDGYILPSASDLLILNVGFLSNWDEALTTSFKLGAAEFTALSNTASPDFTLIDQFVTDVNGSEIPVEQQQVAVPEPETYAFFPLLAGFLFWRKRAKNIKRSISIQKTA